MGRRKLDPADLFVTISGRVPLEVARRLDEEAERRNVTRSAVVNDLVSRGLDAAAGERKRGPNG